MPQVGYPHVPDGPEMNLEQAMPETAREQCERCKDWERRGLSRYCPSCDAEWLATQEMSEEPMPEDHASDELIATGQFLLDRLSEFEPYHHEAANDFCGHVDPAIDRFRAALLARLSRAEAPPAGELAARLHRYVTGPNGEALYPNASSYFRDTIIEAATALTAQEAEIHRITAVSERLREQVFAQEEARKAAEAALAEARALLESLAPLSDDNSPIRKWLARASLADTGAKP